MRLARVAAEKVADLYPQVVRPAGPTEGEDT